MNILIIGATSGIGKALFLKYANADNRIGIVGRRTNLLNELSQQYYGHENEMYNVGLNMKEVECL